MKYSELKKLNCIYDDIEFTPIYHVDNHIPIRDDYGNIIDFELEGFKLLKTAEQNYKDSNSINVQPQEPTKEEVLLKEIANLKVDNMKKDIVTTNALKSIAELKVEIMNMKGEK